MSKILPMYPAYQGSGGHIHTDDDKSMSLGQGLLVIFGGLTIVLALGQFLAWGDHHPGKALLLELAVALFGLLVYYGLSFVRSRDLCQECTPSRFTGKPAL